MSKFRKRPVVIDAIQWTGNNPFEIGEWSGQWERDHTDLFVARNGEIEIKTLEDGFDGHAKHIASIGDWIIRGVQGEFYACKPDIFQQTYERVEE